MATIEEFLRAHLNDVVTVSGYTIANPTSGHRCNLYFMLPMWPTGNSVRLRGSKQTYKDHHPQIRMKRDEEVLVDELGDLYLESLPPRNRKLIYMPLCTQALLVEALEREGRLE